MIELSKKQLHIHKKKPHLIFHNEIGLSIFEKTKELFFLLFFQNLVFNKFQT